MDRDPRDGQGRGQDDDWIFAIDDPHNLPTDRLPDRAAFDRYATPLLARRNASPALPPGENETVDLSDIDLAELEDGAEPDTSTGAIPVLAEEDVEAGETGEIVEDAEEQPLTAPLRTPSPAGPASYARSGTTPNAEHDEIPLGGFTLPERA